MDSYELPAPGRVPGGRRTTRQSWHFPVALVVAAAVVAACSSKPTDPVEPGVPTALAVTTIPTSAPDRAPIGTIVVQVVDGNGDPVDTAGLSVVAALAAGTTGTLSGTKTEVTSASGQATFIDLSIAGAAGSKTIKFTKTGLSPANGIFTLTAGPATTIAANSSQAISGVISQPVTTKPSVIVTDQDGNGVSGVSVTFAVTAGGGSATGTGATTDAAGVATVGSWTMGSSIGVNTMTATSSGLTGSPVTFNATASATASNFNIDLRFLGSGTPSQQAAFATAKARWEQVITGDITPFNANFVNDTACTGGSRPVTVTGTVDDVVIFADLVPIDGVGNILGAASPCYIRGLGGSSPGLTIWGYMKFDTADLTNLENAGDLDDVALHEMGHVLGYGTLWTVLNKMTGYCQTTPLFTGSNAVTAYTTSNGGGAASSVPIENVGSCTNQGGTLVSDGTRDSHWKESVFQSEVMTGFISGTVRPLSLTSIKSMQDLGYVVSAAAADPFNIGTQPTIRLPSAVFHLKDDVLPVKIRVAEPNGQTYLAPGQ